MKHVYLSETAINEALLHHAITKKEARKLKRKVDFCQQATSKSIHR